MLAMIFFLAMLGNASATPIDFNNYTSDAYKGQPQYPNQGVDGTYGIFDSLDINDPLGIGVNNGARLKMHDDIWLNMRIPVTITANTLMHVEIRDRSPQSSEILGFQFLFSFDNPSLKPDYAFSFAGSQSWGITDYRTTGEDWEAFDIMVGDHFTGVFEGIVFYLDDDAGIDAEGRIQNLSFTETPVPEPGTLILLGSGFLGLVGLGYNRKRKKS